MSSANYIVALALEVNGGRGQSQNNVPSSTQLGTVAIADDLAETAVDPGYPGLVAFAEAAGLRLEPFQRRILRAVLGPEAEALILLRGAPGRRR